jgi:hypothetical protein
MIVSPCAADADTHALPVTRSMVPMTVSDNEDDPRKKLRGGRLAELNGSVIKTGDARDREPEPGNRLLWKVKDQAKFLDRLHLTLLLSRSFSGSEPMMSVFIVPSHDK